MRKNRTPLLTTVLMFILCTTILVGATTAYFTENVQVTGNVVQSGNLKAGMDWTDSLVPDANGQISWIDAADEKAAENKIFNYSQWEPGFTAVRYIRIRNEGRLAFQYQLNILSSEAPKAGPNLMDVIDVYYGVVPEQVMQEDGTLFPSTHVKDYADFDAFTQALGLEKMGALSQLNANTGKTWGVMLPESGADLTLVPEEDRETAYIGSEQFCIVLHMQESAGNEYQKLDMGEGFQLQLNATQYTYESDSFGSDYDAEAKSELPTYAGPVTATASIADKVDSESKLMEAITLSSGDVSATVPAGAKVVANATSLTLRITPLTASSAGINLTDSEETASYDVHVEGLAADNAVPVIVHMGEVLPKGLNMGNYGLYHVESNISNPMTLVDAVAALTAHNQFAYDPATGEVTVAMATFSEVAVVADTVNVWNGEYDYSWYNADGSEFTIANADQFAGFGAIVGGMNGQTKATFSGKTVKLISDINLGDKDNTNADLIFYPIGYYNSMGSYEKVSGASVTSSVSSFEGTFDGNGHTISNIYQNTWEMFGDYNQGYANTPNHYNDAMGLFGYVVNGTVKNLTIDSFSSDGEFTPTGVIAAYAENSTFENIAITNCNPRVYNTGNGGIVGVGGDTDDTDAKKLTFTNITIDSSNKITALWGSWDVACGGIMGMFRGNGLAEFNNCHVAAQIDVYNDVCGNYQYYWYRYSGMMIGSIRKNVTESGYTVPDTTGISFADCSATYGDWADYVYCEFTENTQASYTEDYQFSRVEENELNRNGDQITCTHTHDEVEDKRAVLLPFNQLFTGHGWGVKAVSAFNGVTVYHKDSTDGPKQSVTKFKYLGKDTLEADKTYTLEDLFTHIEGTLNVSSNGVVVSITDLDNTDGRVSAQYTAKNAMGWAENTISFSGTGEIELIIQDYYFCTPTIVKITIAPAVIPTPETTATPSPTPTATPEPTPVDKFALVFENTDKYLYRVGNANTVALGSLFKAIDGVDIGNVTISVKPLNGAAVSGTYSANASDWTKGTIQFSGTGPVQVTIDDDAYANALSLYLEVVDAKNITSLESATSNSVVLLNNVSGAFTVSNGHTFYGNGFAVTLPTTVQSTYSSGYVGYVNLNSGNLDNVRIEGPVYPEMYIYRDQAQDNTDTTKVNYFYNSVLINGGNCTISNSYISGSRTALCIRGGNNVIIENTTIAGGAYANMQIAGASTVTLRDLTTVQIDAEDSYDQNKTAHGLGIAVDSAVVDIYIEGELNQHNWLNKEQWNSIVPSTYQSQFPDFFADNTFSKYWHYLNGGTDPYVNMAFIFACNWNTSKIHDNRATVDYSTCNATIARVSGGVYSKLNSIGGNAITDADLADPGYTSPGFNPVTPVFSFDNTANNDADDEANAADTYCVYDESSGTLKIGVTGNSKTLDLSGISITKAGSTLDHTIYLNGTPISGNSVTINVADGTKQTLSFKTATDDAGYDNDGNPIEGNIEYTWTVTVEIAVLAYPAPVWNMGGDYTFDTSNCYYAYYQTSQGYGEAAPIYEGVKVNYYNKSGTLVELDLSGTTTLPTGSNNANANAFTYTLSDGSTLTMKFVSGWKSGATTHQFTAYNSKAYIYPQSLDNDNYVRAKTTNQDFNVKISYTFTDPNGQSTETVTMNWYNAAASNGTVSTVQWKTFDSTNGKEPECITPDTLITLADGAQKEIQHVAYDDQLLVWDFYTGEYSTVTAAALINHGYGTYDVIELVFSDGTIVKTISEHGFFDVDANKFAFINKANADSYIGHRFLKMDGDETTEIVTLTNVTISEEYTASYSILSDKYNNVMVEGLLSLTPLPGVDSQKFFDALVIGNDWKYDGQLMQADIEKYGLYTYEDFQNYITREQFDLVNAPYLKIIVGKGGATFEQILHMIQAYVK